MLSLWIDHETKKTMQITRLQYLIVRSSLSSMRFLSFIPFLRGVYLPDCTAFFRGVLRNSSWNCTSPEDTLLISCQDRNGALVRTNCSPCSFFSTCFPVSPHISSPCLSLSLHCDNDSARKRSKRRSIRRKDVVDEKKQLCKFEKRKRMYVWRNVVKCQRQKAEPHQLQQVWQLHLCL